MNNLKTFDNLYASFSQSTYEDRPYSFMNELNEEIVYDGDTVKVNYSEIRRDKDDIILGGKNLPNNGIVYVHKDKSVNIVKEYMSAGDYMEYEKGLFKDDLMGFQSYFLSDTPQLNNETKNIY